MAKGYCARGNHFEDITNPWDWYCDYHYCWLEPIDAEDEVEEATDGDFKRSQGS